MGALTSNRKRGNDYFFPFSNPIDQSCGHIAKKPKPFVSMNQNTPRSNPPGLSISVVSRIAQYPERKSGFPREVHAPVRNSRFRSSSFAKSTEITASSGEGGADKMWNYNSFWRLLSYQKAKNSAMGALRYVTGKQKDKEVIEIDSEDENCNGVSDDSSIEELEILDSVGNKWKGGQGAVEYLQEPKGRKVEKDVRSLDSSVISEVSNAIANVNDRGKARLSLLDQVSDESGVPSYMKLHASAKKRDAKLANLEFDIELTEKHLKALHMLRPQKKKELTKKDVAKECFVPLSEEEVTEVNHAFSNSNRRKVLVTHENSNIDISGEKLQCLRPGAWLNDEVINVYLELLKERERREPQKFLKCHFCNTFFYKKLISGRSGYNFPAVRRWTTQKKLGYSLLECDKIFVPIHKEVHWCLAIINHKDEKFQYLDSLGGVDSRVLDVLARYFVDEVKDKCGKDIDVSSWDREFVTELPEQKNGFDCGMFMIKYADFYSRDIGLCFTQEHMSYFRQRTAKELLRLRAE